MFEHAKHSVMNGEHELLAPAAKERIPLNSDTELKIAQRIRQLAEQYTA
ncbi:hypothetical protein PRECH8_25490 [Insulibacter thermoxylanivorax]|uniref:Uncharacterized protein n=1 Tax=Insulibacter thermoxylanivorax TaxID=2749268 RepID=A0A916QGX4_9BACL|nr:hypothetical protein PRECH8_25490 [Insulibacter thermoxylanivorax]